MFIRIFRAAIKRPPIVTILLIASCFVTTIPQFFLKSAYSEITGITALTNLVSFTLPTFSHDPKILAIHLLLNTLVFLFFGSILETLLGRNRFALLSLVTFITSTVLVFCRGTTSHGASGICWGYQIVVVFVLIVYYEKSKVAATKDPWAYFYIFFILFNFIIIPAIEVFLIGIKFGDNFGQYVHLASNIVAVPFVLLWRKQIEASVQELIDAKLPEMASGTNKMPLLILASILIYNLGSTVIAVWKNI